MQLTPRAMRPQLLREPDHIRLHGEVRTERHAPPRVRSGELRGKGRRVLKCGEDCVRCGLEWIAYGVVLETYPLSPFTPRPYPAMYNL